MLLRMMYVVIGWNSDTLEIGGNHLPHPLLEWVQKHRGFVLWRRDGAYGVLPAAAITNLREQWDNLHQGLKRGADWPETVPAFQWDQTLPLDSRIGRLLEQGEQLTDDRATQNPAPSSESDQQETEPVEPFRGGA